MSRHPHSLKRQKKLIKNKEFLLKLFSEKCLELTPENYSDVYRQVDNQLLVSTNLILVVIKWHA